MPEAEIASTDVPFDIEEGEEGSEEVEDTTHLPQAEEVIEESEDEGVRVVIAKEVEELYGYNPEFTFTRKDDVYDITLDTGENLVLAANYINSMVNN